MILDRAEVAAIVRPGTYVLAAVLWSFQGLQDTEKLAYAAAPLDRPVEQLAPTLQRDWLLRVAHGMEWLEARNVIDLDRAYDVANEYLFGKLDAEYETFVSELRAKNEDRADLQLRSLEQHFQRQMRMLEETLEKHRAARRDGLVKATEGRIRALQARVEQQRLRIESRREVRSNNREIAIAVIQVK